MNAILRVMILVAVFAAQSEAYGGWAVRQTDKGASNIHYEADATDSDASSLSDLLTLIDFIGSSDVPQLKQIAFTRFFLDDDRVQKELMTQFGKGHSEVLKAAMTSSGNIHNPKVLPLRAVFEECLLKTPTVTKIASRLQEAGYRLSGVSHEKFFLDKSTNPVVFRSFVWLTISKSNPGQTSNECRESEGRGI